MREGWPRSGCSHSLPSHLHNFVAAGLLGTALIPLTAAFFAGRLVSYSLYVSAASPANRSLGGVVSKSLTSPLGIAVQVLMLVALVALVRVDWTRVVRCVARRKGDPRAEQGPEAE